MRRRDVISIFGGLIATPLTAHAQQPMPVLGFLSSGPSHARKDQIGMLFRGLRDSGYVEGRNLAVEYRWANDQYDRLPALAAELVKLRVSVIAATGGPVTALAAKSATSTIPIVFTAVSDPLSYGLIASFNRPGGNLTGTAGLVAELDAKRLELIREMLPAATRIGALVNPNRPNVQAQIRNLAAAAQSTGQQLVVLRAGTQAELDTLFADPAQDRIDNRIDALVVAADPFFNSRRELLVGLLTRHRIPAIFQWREFTAAGGLMSYGPSVGDAYEKAGVYIARVLKGEKPADLPVQQPTKFDLVVNLKTAQALGVAIPPTLIARADEVIE